MVARALEGVNQGAKTSIVDNRLEVDEEVRKDAELSHSQAGQLH